MASNNPSSAATNRLGMRYVTKGAPGLRARLNEIIRAFDYLFPCLTGDIVTDVTPQGALPRFRVPQISASASRVREKWIPVIVAGAAKVTVTNPGDVENIIPTIGGALLTATPAPELTVVTGDVYFECTMDAAGTFTAVEIKSAASMPANTSTLRYRRLYTVTVSGTSVVITSQPVTTSVSHKLCGGLSTWGQA